MEVSPDVAEERMAYFIETCKSAGIKVTHQRVEIFRDLATTDEHPDVETLYRSVRARVPSVSLDTVYRTLRMLVDLNLAATVDTSPDRLRFDANVEPHHHFHCVECDRTFDFTCEEFDNYVLTQHVKHLGCVETLQLTLRGICARCCPAEKRRSV